MKAAELQEELEADIRRVYDHVEDGDGICAYFGATECRTCRVKAAGRSDDCLTAALLDVMERTRRIERLKAKERRAR